MDFEVGKTGRILNLRNLLSNMTADDVYEAAKTFDRLQGNIDSFEDSSTYQVIVGNTAYPPKPIFGLAASKTLNQQVRSEHFTGGERSTSFRILQDLGFKITLKAARPGQSDGLKLYELYSREDAQKLLGPDDTFTKGSGTWGIQGIIRDRPSQGDVVLFVTLGTHDGNNYDDALTEDGALIWKSQNRYAATSPVIRALSGHNEDENVVYLFLRSDRDRDYVFLGPLALKDWDPLSSHPVHMIWTLLSGPVPTSVASEHDLNLKPALSPFKIGNNLSQSADALTETAPPKPSKKSINNRVYGTKKQGDWSDREERNRDLGFAGEKLVIAAELKELRDAGRDDLADRLEHTALVDSAAGYDIASFDPATGEKRLIEVKTTTGPIYSAFFISANEVRVSEDQGESYFIYRLYSYSPDSGAKFYKVNGPVRNSFNLDATNFRATLKARPV